MSLGKKANKKKKKKPWSLFRPARAFRPGAKRRVNKKAALPMSHRSGPEALALKLEAWPSILNREKRLAKTKLCAIRFCFHSLFLLLSSFLFYLFF